jgi:hypothetical protein
MNEWSKIEEILCEEPPKLALDWTSENKEFIAELIPARTAPFCWDVIIFIQNCDLLRDHMESRSKKVKQTLKKICCEIYKKYCDIYDHRAISKEDQVIHAQGVIDKYSTVFRSQKRCVVNIEVVLKQEKPYEINNIP